MTPPDLSRMTDRLTRLVGFNTENPPGRELEAGQYLLAELQAMGFDVSLSELIPGRVNVIGRLSNGPGPVCAFNSHIDVVPAGEGWSRDPFALIENNGRLYGRGSCDAKGPIVSMLEAMQHLAAMRERWSGTLLGIFVADEETQSRGAKNYVRDRPDIDYVVVGEPTSNATVTAHKGSLRPIVRVYGETAHSGLPDAGENAILKAARLLGLIERTHEKIRANCHELVGSASLTVTRISGGHADNVVPDRTEFLLDRRLVPGEDEATAKSNSRTFSISRGANTTSTLISSNTNRRPAARRRLHKSRRLSKPVSPPARATAARMRPRRVFRAVAIWCIFVRLARKGWCSAQGSIAVAHKPDEFVPIDEFANASLIYRDIAQQMLAGHGEIKK